MKKVLMLLCLFCTSLVFSEHMIMSCKKTYVTPPQIHILEKELIVTVNDVHIAPTSLHIDRNGYYFDAIYLDKRVPGPWQCKRCLTWNEEWRDYCKVCQASRPK